MSEISLLERLREALIAVRDRHGDAASTLYAVIDPILADPFPDAAGEAREGVVLPADKFAPGDCPYLLTLGEFGRDPRAEATIALSLQETLAQQGGDRAGRSVCGWLVLPAGIPVEQAVRAYARQSQLVVGGERRTFRFWDPRTLDLARDVLTPTQLNAILGPAASWSWLSRQRRLETVWIDPREHDALYTVAIQTNEEQQRLLSRLPEINLVMDSLTVAALDTTPIKAIEVGRRLVEADVQWRLHDPRDQVSYAICCMIYGAPFTANAPIRLQLIHGLETGTPAMPAVLGMLDTLEPQLVALESGAVS